jgi:RNA-directed DNA polymerase
MNRDRRADEGLNLSTQSSWRINSMDSHQQTKAVEASSPRHDEPGEGGTGAERIVELKLSAAIARRGALTSQLMEQVVKPDNLNQSYARVVANKGSPGIDRMRVDHLADWIGRHKQTFIASLLDGSYQPQPVRGVNIPKPGGGQRQLGIPTVIDRLVQQAFLQVLTPILDPTFSPNSYGFRPGKSAHSALHAAREHVAEGYTTVVDIDLSRRAGIRSSQPRRVDESSGKTRGR